MKAAVLREFGKPMCVEQVELPEPDDEDVLVRIRACGVDGTDLKLIQGFGYRPELPFVTGHEPSGVVERVGSRVEGFVPGDRVITHNFSVCGKCPLCLSNRANICPYMTAVLGARNLPGGHAEFLRVPARQLVTIPDGISWADAAVLTDAGITAFHAIDRASLRLGETVLIMGVGGVGSYAVQFAKLSGCSVIAVDVTREKLDRALSLGADFVVDGTQANVAEEVQRHTQGWGVDCSLDIVGNLETLGWGLEALRNGGRLVVVGYTPDEYPLSGMRMAQKELQIIGSRCGRKQDLLDVAQLVASGATRSIVTDQLPLDQINEALNLLQAGKVLGRMVLQVSD